MYIYMCMIHYMNTCLYVYDIPHLQTQTLYQYTSERLIIYIFYCYCSAWSPIKRLGNSHGHSPTRNKIFWWGFEEGSPTIYLETVFHVSIYRKAFPFEPSQIWCFDLLGARTPCQQHETAFWLLAGIRTPGDLNDTRVSGVHMHWPSRAE